MIFCLIVCLRWDLIGSIFKAPSFGQRINLLGIRPLIFRFQPKPKWVKKEIIRLKALMPTEGCRKISAVFNRIYLNKRNMTVSKSHVCNVVRQYRYEIQVLRRKIKNARPKPVPKNLVWGMDLTGKTDTQGKLHMMLGIIEHHSRACLDLTALENKKSITLLMRLFMAVKKYGKPKFVRTDNESVFTSRLFRMGLWLLGVRHQRTEVGCPWQNGKIERFFGTLKEKLNQMEFRSRDDLGGALNEFRFWYNHVRPHQNLDGRTPAEVWQGVDIYSTSPKKEYWFEAWEGLLTGYYLPT